MQAIVGRGHTLTIEDSVDKGEDLGTSDERGHGDNGQSQNEGAGGNMGEDNGNEREGDV